MKEQKEWKIIFYRDKDGNSPVEEFMETLTESEAEKMETLIEFLEEKGINLHRPYSDYLRDDIHELRIKLSRGESRTLYFFCYGDYIVLTHTFYKQNDKVPINEINKALEYKQDFINRYSINNIEEA